jgi:hypothetical protein
VQDNVKLRAEIAIRDEKIQQLSDHVNRIDQATRSSSLRILGLHVTPQSPPAQVFDAVYKDILEPILEAAKSCGDISPQTSLPPHFLIVNAFAIPAKKNTSSSPVIVKLHSEFIRSLVFRVFTKFRILEISYISNVFFYFVHYSKVATISRK